MPDEQVARLLTGTIDLLEAHGWIQGKDRTNDGFCLIGAMNTALFLEEGQDYIIYARARSFMKGATGEDSLATWNDRSGRTYDEVKAALLRALTEARSVG